MAALDDATQWRVLFQFSQELLSIVVGEHGLKCVATRDIAARQVILVEPPVATFDMNPFGQGAQFMARPDVQALQQEIMRCASANAGREGTDAYPVEAREAIEDIVALSATVQLASLDAATVDRVFAFEDSFRTAIAGEHVCVDGLASAAGQLLNGRRGVVLRVEGNGRRRVRLLGGPAGETDKAVRAENLKSIGGILRTNSFEDENRAKLFETLCRFNHACGASANVTKVFENLITGTGARCAHVTTLRDIRRGEELCIDYIVGSNESSLDTAPRRAYLQMKYNFVCQCSKCAPVP
jgi:hypothetical protein